MFFIRDALTLGLSDPLAWNSSYSGGIIVQDGLIGLQYHRKRHLEAC